MKMNNGNASKRRVEVRRQLQKRERRVRSGRPTGRLAGLWHSLRGPAHVLLATIALYLLLRPTPRTISSLEQGQIAPVPISSPFEFSYVNKSKQAAAEKKAKAEVWPVFRCDENLRDVWASSVSGLFEGAARLQGDPNLQPDKRVDTFKKDFQEKYPKLPNDAWSAILGLSTRPGYAQSLLSLLRETAEQIMASVDDQNRASNAPGINVIYWDGTRGKLVNPAELKTIDEVRKSFESDLGRMFPNDAQKREREIGYEILRATVQPTLVFDRSTTGTREAEAVAKIPPEEYTDTVRANEEIVPAGKEIDYDAWQKIGALNRIQSQEAISPHVGAFLLSLVIWTSLAVYLRRHHPSQIHEPRFLSFVFGLCLLVLWGAWGLERVSARLDEPYGGIGYLLPVALVGMLVSALIDGKLAAALVGICAILAGIILGNRIDLIAVYFLAGLVSTSRVAGIKKWADFYKAGAVVSVTALGAYLGLYLIQRPFHSMAPELSASFWSGVVCAGLSGMVSTAGTLFLLHPLENFLGVTTNLKLLEYSARNETLRELDREAPGTYQHSLHVSTLAEAAADAIGANPLICRVASLYHDIGKLRKPQYFSENQTTANEKKIHAKLSANLSCLLIRNHVKDGLEAAERLKLPTSVMDIIAQHHGTTLISFFYEKALSENPGGKIRESDFRYPGPKPQTVECAIVMLADSVEASSRSLKDTGPGDIQLLVRKVINGKFMDGQFDECDLTLKSLHALSDCFANSLYSLLHRRVSYPRETEDSREARPLKVKKEIPEEAGASEVE